MKNDGQSESVTALGRLLAKMSENPGASLSEVISDLNIDIDRLVDEVAPLARTYDLAEPDFRQSANALALTPRELRYHKHYYSERIQAMLERGTHEVHSLSYYCEERPKATGDGTEFADLYDEEGRAIVKSFRIRRIPRKERPRCGARLKSRPGETCEARVCIKPDESGFANRCRIHGGLTPRKAGKHQEIE